MTSTIFAYASPIGVLTLVSNGAALSGVYFENHKPGGPPKDALEGADKALDAARKQLDAYFAGRRQSFDLPLALAGTPFQRSVWAELAHIPFGETTTYGAIAAAIGKPAAVRAVGAAVGRNPVSIVLPCHRVLGARGALTGFAGGIERKRFLLALERDRVRAR